MNKLVFRILVFSLSLTLYLLSLVFLSLTPSQTASLSHSLSISGRSIASSQIAPQTSCYSTTTVRRALSRTFPSPELDNQRPLLVTVIGKFQNPNPIIASTDLGFIIFILGRFNLVVTKVRVFLYLFILGLFNWIGKKKIYKKMQNWGVLDFSFIHHVFIFFVFFRFRFPIFCSSKHSIKC